jgi:hypothetical protein
MRNMAIEYKQRYRQFKRALIALVAVETTLDWT